jgi:hypothetical protein
LQHFYRRKEINRNSLFREVLTVVSSSIRCLRRCRGAHLLIEQTGGGQHEDTYKEKQSVKQQPEPQGRGAADLDAHDVHKLGQCGGHRLRGKGHYGDLVLIQALDNVFGLAEDGISFLLDNTRAECRAKAALV